MTKMESVKNEWIPKVISVGEKCHAFVQFLTNYPKRVREVNTQWPYFMGQNRVRCRQDSRDYLIISSTF